MVRWLEQSRGARMSSMTRRRKIPGYVWMLLVLVVGIGLGGIFPARLGPVSLLVVVLIRWIVRLVPILIFMALSPAIAGLVRRGRAGRLAGAVVGWYLLTSVIAGLFGLSVSTFLFDVPFSGGANVGWSEAGGMLATLGEGGASVALIAIGVAIVVGLAGAKSDGLYRLLAVVEGWIASAGPKLGRALIPFIFLMGISVGVQFGARLGMANYLAMTAYTAFLCLARVWSSWRSPESTPCPRRKTRRQWSFRTPQACRWPAIFQEVSSISSGWP